MDCKIVKTILLKKLVTHIFIFQDGFAVPEEDGDDLPPQPVEEF